ncbi:hypothetical protein TSUD_260270 [Trifolium subterraneum]|nr:hypothetical protein TSUD_260270 [Trifolium subterraneum]
MKMKISIFLVLFLVIISCAKVISNEDEKRSLIQSNVQAHGLNGNLDGNKHIEASTRLNHKDVLAESQNEQKHEPHVIIRKGGGGGISGGGGRGGGGSGRGGGGRGGGVIGGGGRGGGGNTNENGNIEASTRLNLKDVLVKSQNENKHDLFVTVRKGGRGGGGIGRGGRGRSGGATTGIIGGGVIGGAAVNHGHDHGHNHGHNHKYNYFHFCVSTFILCLSFFF